MNDIIIRNKHEFEKIFEYTKKELSGIRTGRANPLLVEDIKITAYGTPTPLQHIASINVPEARTITIQPWDRNLLKDIEKDIIAAKIGLNPINDGKCIRINIPQLTAENRRDLVKLVKQKTEQAKIKLRNLRDKIREEVVKMHKDKKITDDDKYDMFQELDNITKEYHLKIEKQEQEKEKDITKF